jgi:hypothetical protein
VNFTKNGDGSGKKFILDPGGKKHRIPDPQHWIRGFKNPFLFRVARNRDSAVPANLDQAPASQVNADPDTGKAFFFLPKTIKTLPVLFSSFCMRIRLGNTQS